MTVRGSLRGTDAIRYRNTLRLFAVSGSRECFALNSGGERAEARCPQWLPCKTVRMRLAATLLQQGEQIL